MAAGLDVILREVGPRDGLQNIAATMATADKIAWIAAEAAAGVGEIEVSSFVPPRLLPQLADSAEVTAAAVRIPGLTAAVLVPNLKGAERALAAGARKINFVLSVSESHNRANVRRTTAESVAEFGRVVALCREAGPDRPEVTGGLSTAFGCSIEGPVSEDRVRALAAELAAAGADEIIVADTVGYGDPAAVRRLLRAVTAEAGGRPVAAHFHDTRGLGLANLLAALDVGVTRFDASLAGLGGCPFAPGATGNIATEDAAFMLERMGLRTGIDLAALLEVRRIVATALPGVALEGRLARAGLPRSFPD